MTSLTLSEGAMLTACGVMGANGCLRYHCFE
jgi:hypothetical protein